MTLRSNSEAAQHPDLLDSSIIRGPELAPFTARPTCPSCGTGSISRFANLLRVLHGEGKWNTFGSSYCPGGKMPTEASSHPIGAMLGHEVVHPCAGITEPHLHKNCGHCGYTFLMKTKEQV